MAIGSANFENLNLNFAEIHNKRLYIHKNGIVDTSKNNIDLSFIKDSFYIKKQSNIFIKEGNGKTVKVEYKGIDYTKIFSYVKYKYFETTGKKWESRKGPRINQNNIFKEMVVNTKANTTKEDLIALQTALNKLGIKVIEMSLHNDEGHVKNDKIKHNRHCHIIFLNADKNGIVKRWQKKDLIALQTLVCEVLGMERGERGSKAKRLTAQQYKKQMQKIANVENEYENKIETLKKDYTQQINDLENQLLQLKTEYKKDRQQLIDSKTALQKDYTALKTEFEETNTLLVKAVNKLKSVMQNKTIQQPKKPQITMSF